MALNTLFEGVFGTDSLVMTKNLDKGRKAYGEELVSIQGTEYRVWNPYRSKLCAAIRNGLKELPLKRGSKVLYLGSAEGTTISHISDIVGKEGAVFGIDISAKAMRKFTYLCESRDNIIPVLADASGPESYAEYVGDFKIDLLYQDVSQKNQGEIFSKNAEMHLREGGYGMLAVKARSISPTRPLMEIVDSEIEKVKGLKAVQKIPLKPFDKEHVMVIFRKG